MHRVHLQKSPWFFLRLWGYCLKQWTLQLLLGLDSMKYAAIPVHSCSFGSRQILPGGYSTAVNVCPSELFVLHQAFANGPVFICTQNVDTVSAFSFFQKAQTYHTPNGKGRWLFTSSGNLRESKYHATLPNTSRIGWPDKTQSLLVLRVSLTIAGLEPHTFP